MKTRPGEWKIEYILSQVGGKTLNLRPDFQRFYIWNRKKEEAFIDSILRGYPVPPVWVWKRSGPKGRTLYEVIDGQQRLSCIRRFTDNVFALRVPPNAPADPDLTHLNDRFFSKGAPARKLPIEFENRLMGYTIPYIEVETDDRGLVIDIFRRLNVSSTNLTPQELRHAFFAGQFKQSVYEMTEAYQKDRFWKDKERVFAPATTDRMGTQQFVSDLYVAMIKNKVQDRSEALDEYYEQFDRTWRKREQYEKAFRQTMKTVKHLLPGPSRFTKNTSDFYTLFLLLHEYHSDKNVTLDTVSLSNIGASLKAFETAYTLFLDTRGKEVTGLRLFESYRETIVGRQREKEMREVRRQIVNDLLAPGLTRATKDPQRFFSDEQKRYIWEVASPKMCALCGQQVARYEDYEPDHVIPHSQGGRSTIVNGQVAHEICNQKKGAQRKPPESK